MTRSRILIVEDEKIVAVDLQMRLENRGHEVIDIVSTGEEAVAKARETCPDLILMDITLKGRIDGVQAAAEIRAARDVPVIYVTAHADASTLDRAKITGPFGYVLKPFEEQELHTAIEMALYKHAMDRRLRESERWLATTLRSIADAVVTTDREGTITFLNPYAEQLTGWSQSEALGRPLADQPAGSSFAWTLFTPEATLFRGSDKQIITHFFAPNPCEANTNPKVVAGGTIRAAW